MTKIGTPVTEPNKPYKSLLPPTEMDTINQQPNPKYGFKEAFEQPELYVCEHGQPS